MAFRKGYEYLGRTSARGSSFFVYAVSKKVIFLQKAVGFYLNHAYKTVNRELKGICKVIFCQFPEKGDDAMMYQKIIVPIDHGNRNMKTEHKIFTSGFVEGDCRPALGEYLQYNGRYYALTEQRIPYMRDKTLDDRFFILTLFAVAMEAEKQMLNAKDTLLQAVLPVGLPPKHYGALYRKFEDYRSEERRVGKECM